MAPAVPPAYGAGRGRNVGDDAWMSSLNSNNHFLPNLVGLDIETMQYNGMGNRFASQRNYKQLVQAHGVLAATSFLLLVPLAVMIAQFSRGCPPRQRASLRRLHVRLQLGSVVLATSAFSLGCVAVGLHRTLTNPHHIIGVALYVMLLAQVVIRSCWTRSRSEGRPSLLGTWVHQWLGRLTALLGLAQVPLGLCLYGSPQVLFILYAVVAGVLLLLYIVLSYVYDEPGMKGSNLLPNAQIPGEKLDEAPKQTKTNIEAISPDNPSMGVNGVAPVKTTTKSFMPTVQKISGTKTTNKMAPISRAAEEEERVEEKLNRRNGAERTGMRNTEAETKHEGTETDGAERDSAEKRAAEKKTSNSQNRARRSRAVYRASVKPQGKPLEQNILNTKRLASISPANKPVPNVGLEDYPKMKTEVVVSTVGVHKEQPQERQDKGPPNNTITTPPEIRAPKPEESNEERPDEDKAATSSIKTESDTNSDPQPQETLINNAPTTTTPEEAPEPAKKKRIIRKKPAKKTVAPPANETPTIPDQQHEQIPSRLSSWDNIPEHYRLDGDETDGQSVSSYLWDAGSAHRRAFALHARNTVLETTHLPGVLEVPPLSSQPQVGSEDGDGDENEDEIEVNHEADAKADGKDDDPQPEPQSRRGSIVVPAAVMPRPISEANAGVRELRRVGPATNGFAQALAYMYRNMKRPGPEVLPGFVPYVSANDDSYLKPGGQK